MTWIQRMSLVLVLCQPSLLFAQSVSPANQSHGRAARVPFVGCASYLGGRYQEGSTSEAAALLEEAAVDPKTVAQDKTTAPESVGMPRPAVDLTVGTWKYKETFVAPIGGTDHSTYSITIKDDGGVWIVTTAMEFSEGTVTDVSTLEKGTMILRKESFEHFAHPGQPWKPVAIKLDFTGNRVTGAMKYVSGQDKPVAVDLGGPLFAGPDVTIGSLPLADGYSTTFRYFDIDRFALNPQASNKVKLVQIRVVGMERVTVPAGTFDSYRVELTSADGGSNKATIWIAKDSRMLVRASAVDELYGAITTEMVP
jgi:hypothetical protein